MEPKNFPQTPGLVINALLEKTGKTIEEVDLIEINEAFAAVALVSNQIAGLDENKVNVNGGAVALGHPIGASGARIVLTLAYELKRRGGGIGIAAICSGGGQGDAIMIEVARQGMDNDNSNSNGNWCRSDGFGHCPGMCTGWIQCEVK